MQEGDALHLKIAAKYQFFREADDQAEKSPRGNLLAVGGSEFHKFANGVGLFLFRRNMFGRDRF